MASISTGMRPGLLLEIGDGDPLSWGNGSCDTATVPTRKVTVQVKAITVRIPVEVTCDGEGLTSRAWTRRCSHASGPSKRSPVSSKRPHVTVGFTTAAHQKKSPVISRPREEHDVHAQRRAMELVSIHERSVARFRRGIAVTTGSFRLGHEEPGAQLGVRHEFQPRLDLHARAERALSALVDLMFLRTGGLSPTQSVIDRPARPSTVDPAVGSVQCLSCRHRTWSVLRLQAPARLSFTPLVLPTVERRLRSHDRTITPQAWRFMDSSS